MGVNHADLRDRTIRIARNEVPVEAANEAEAIRKLFDGEADPVEQSQDFIEVADDYGLPAEEHRELAEALRNQGITVNEVIPSIRSIQKV